VTAKLAGWFENPDAVTAHIQQRLEDERRRLFSGDPDAHAAALRERVAKLERMMANYRRQQAEEVISMDELKAVLGDLVAQRRAAKDELEKIENRRGHMGELERDAKLALDFYAACAHLGLENLTPEQRKDVYRRLHLRVTVETDGSLTITGEPDANYLPEVGEVDRATKEEARELDRAIQSLRWETNDCP
jgi:hypothetical protein